MADEVEAVEEVDLASLPDALLLHVLESLGPSIADLGRCRCVSTRFSAITAEDEGVWRAACAALFGLETSPSSPDGDACTSFFTAARAWSALSVQLGLGRAARPTLAPLYTRARDTWGRLKTWAAAHLPEASRSIGPPATSEEWSRFMRWLELTEDMEAGLLALRLLSAVHDGQRFLTDIDSASHQARGRGYGGPASSVESIEHQLSLLKMAASGAAVASGEAVDEDREAFLGLCGGFSAYDTCLCVRLFPLLLVATWTQFFRDDYNLPRHLLVVAGSYNFQRFLILDAHSGELLACPASTPAPGRTVVPISPRQPLRAQRALPTDLPVEADLLTYLEELSLRVERGVYVAEPLVPLEPSTRGLSVFPQGGARRSHAVTRGFLVTAASIYSPEIGMSVYSIRIKLLAPAEEGGMSAAERGFETAQLSTRHWVLTKSSGEQEFVNGPGVVGRFPLFREGGWREDKQTDASGRLQRGEQCDGLFVYQSMSGRGTIASFEGEIVMVPGSIDRPTGEEFRIAVARFPIVCQPTEFII